MEIRTFEYKKEFTKSISFELPTEIEYHFQTGIRRSIAIIPEFYKNEVYSLTFICVYLSFECRIEKDNIRVNSMEDIYHIEGNSKAKGLVEFVMFRDKHTIRTKEQFEADFANAVKEIKDLLKKNRIQPAPSAQ